MKNIENFRIGKYRVGNPKRFLLFLNVMIIIALVITTTMMMKVLIDYGNKFVTVEKYNMEMKTLEKKFDKTVSLYEKKIASLTAERNKDLVSYNKTLAKYKKDKVVAENKYIKLDRDSAKIMKKYWYIYRDYNKTTDLKLTDLLTLDAKCKKENVNPHFVVGTMGLESKLYSKSKSRISSASGLGQFISSTGKFVYKKLMASRGTYNHRNMTQNPKTSINMTITYLKYQLVHTNRDAKRVLMIYSGKCLGTRYYDIVNNNLYRAGFRQGIKITTYI